MTLWPFQQVACFEKPYSRSFVAPRCSAAYCFHLLCAASLFFFPFFASFASDHFWVKEGSYHEQPLVSFAHEAVVLLAGESPSDAVGWSSKAGLDGLLPGKVRVPIVRSTALDSNLDGVPDSWKLELEMPSGNISKGYRHLTLLTVYTVELRYRVLEKIGALAALDVSAPFPATGVWARGQLRLRQTGPLYTDYQVRDVYAESPLDVRWASNWANRHTPLSLRALLDRYASRNESVHLETIVPPVWDYTPRDSFRIEVVIDVPPQLVHYVSAAFEVLKYAWMQFLSFLIPTWVVLHSVKAFAFDHQLVETYVVPHLPPRLAPGSSS